MLDFTHCTAAHDPIILVNERPYRHELAMQAEPEPEKEISVLDFYSLTTTECIVPAAVKHSVDMPVFPVAERINRAPLRIGATGDAQHLYVGEIWT